MNDAIKVGKEGELMQLSDRLTKLFAGLQEVYNRLKTKRDHCFGSRPEKPMAGSPTGELRGAGPGMVSELREKIGCIEDMAGCIRSVTSDLENL
jgi:hypothetical protein